MSAGRSLREQIAAPHPGLAPPPHSSPCEPGVHLLRGIPYAAHDGSRPLELELELDLWLQAANGLGAAPGALRARRRLAPEPARRHGVPDAGVAPVAAAPHRGMPRIRQKPAT
ncbi:hypothetical protein [Streptomyces sp. NBC_00344]|uniref:hypothetical protein n=1 Tax=Streptomyces sp. NBC_00344 TaxID=2975720 RepID=UPI002E24AD3A